MTEEQKASRHEEIRRQAEAMAKYLWDLLMEAVATAEAEREQRKSEDRSTTGTASADQSPASPQGGEMQSTSSTGFYRVFKTSPTARADFFGIQQDSGPNQLGIFDNDFDPDDDVFLLSSVSSASHGAIDFTDNAFTFRYTPELGFFGTDTFTYTVTNLTGGRATATATVFVNQAGNSRPAGPQPAVTLATNTYSATMNPLAGATDPDSDPVSFVAVTTPRLGTVTNVAGQLHYNHPSNYFGPDSFDYFLTDGRGGLTRVHVTIEQADGDNDGMADEWEILVGRDPTVNDANADPDGDGLPNLAEYMLGTDPRVAGNPLALDKITTGQAFSNYARIPLSLSAPIEKLPINLLMNGETAGAFLQQRADGSWDLTWDTGLLLNGNYSVAASFQFNPDAQPPIPGTITSPAKTVRVTNEVIFDQINSGFSDFWSVHLTFAYAPANWRIELYDEDGSGLVAFQGTDSDGELFGLWDLTDTGQGGQQISFGNILAYVYAAPAPQGLPPVGQQSAAKANRWFTKEIPGGIGDKFVVAWGWDAYSSTFNERRSNLMLDGVINIIGNPGLDDEYSLLPQINAPFCCTFRYDTDQDRDALMAALASPDAGNFFWFGHGSQDAFQGNADKSTTTDGNVENWLQNKKHRSKPPKYSYSNKHPYRLVILNGCKTYGKGWANAFGIDYTPGGSTNIVFEYQFLGRTPQAFVGWTADVEVPSSADAGGTAHVLYAQALGELFSRWMGGFPLDLCLEFYGNSATASGFDDQDKWKISGCVDLQRQNP